MASETEEYDGYYYSSDDGDKSLGDVDDGDEGSKEDEDSKMQWERAADNPNAAPMNYRSPPPSCKTCL
jgi:hypothetical protein